MGDTKLLISCIYGGREMRMSPILIALVMVSLISGCYMGINGRVIDAETHQPIEGAVVLVEWTKTHGLGEHWTESIKAAEAISDKDGNIHLPGCYSPFIGSPRVVVFKNGYVAWDNLYIFPLYERRTDFEWGSGYLFKLDKFKEGIHDRKKHALFLYMPIADNKIVPNYFEVTRQESIIK
jgi:hypothetical protein